MVAPLRALRNTFELVTQAQMPATAVDVIDNDAPSYPDLPTDLASDASRSTKEQFFPHTACQSPSGGHEDSSIAHSPGHYGRNIRQVASTFQVPNREVIANGPVCSSPPFAGPFGLSEESLVRLEAGLRAQREGLIARPAQFATGSEGPADDSVAHQRPEQFALPSEPAAPLAPELMSRLRRAAQLDPVPGLTLPDEEGRVQFPPAIEPSSAGQAPVRLPSSPLVTAHADHLRFPHFIISASMAVLLLLSCTVSMPELVLVHLGTFKPAQDATFPQSSSSSVQVHQQVDSLTSNNPVPSEIGPKLQATTMTSAPARPEGPLQRPFGLETADQSALPSQLTPPSSSDQAPRRPHRGRRIPAAQKTR